MQISKWIIAFVAVYGGVGGILFDSIIPATARQHMRNPAWPPHAKFHNGQTMALGSLNMIASLMLLFVVTPSTISTLIAAAFIAESYFAAMLIATMFAGTAWSDPEFDRVNPRPLGIPVQKLISLVATCLVVVALILAFVPQ